MEKLTQKWAIVAFLENVDEGAEFYYTDFPLHVTFAGVFATSMSGRQLADELAGLLAGVQAIEIEADSGGMFGPNSNVAVMKVIKTPGLMNIYSMIHGWLRDMGATFNSPQYEGEGYIPHSTPQKSGSLREGERRLLNSVSIIDLFPNGDGHRRKVHTTIKLQ